MNVLAKKYFKDNNCGLFSVLEFFQVTYFPDLNSDFEKAKQQGRKYKTLDPIS